MNKAELAGNITFKDINTYLNVAVRKATLRIDINNYKNYLTLETVSLTSSSDWNIWTLKDFDGHVNLIFDNSLRRLFIPQLGGKAGQLGIWYKDIRSMFDTDYDYIDNVSKFFGQYCSVINETDVQIAQFHSSITNDMVSFFPSIPSGYAPPPSGNGAYYRFPNLYVLKFDSTTEESKNYYSGQFIWRPYKYIGLK